MSEEQIEFSEKLSMALKDSFYKMIGEKIKLNQDVVTSDANGQPIVISAEEALLMATRMDNK